MSQGERLVSFILQEFWDPRNVSWDLFIHPILISSDAYIWDTLKEDIFWETPPATIVELLEKYTTHVRGMKEPFCYDMFEDLRERYEYCLKHNGKHIERVCF